MRVRLLVQVWRCPSGVRCRDQYDLPPMTMWLRWSPVGSFPPSIHAVDQTCGSVLARTWLIARLLADAGTASIHRWCVGTPPVVPLDDRFTLFAAPLHKRVVVDFSGFAFLRRRLLLGPGILSTALPTNPGVFGCQGLIVSSPFYRPALSSVGVDQCY